MGRHDAFLNGPDDAAPDYSASGAIPQAPVGGTPPQGGGGIDYLLKAAGLYQKFVPSVVDPLGSAQYGAAKYLGAKGKQLNTAIQGGIGDAVDAASQANPQDELKNALAGTIAGTAAQATIPQDGPSVILTAAGLGGALERPVAALAEGIPELGSQIVEHASRTVGGRSKGAFDMLRRNGEQVMGYARQGMALDSLTGKEVPAALQAAQGKAVAAQDLVDGVSKGAGRSFADMNDYLKSAPENSQRIDVAGKVFDKMEPFIKTQTPYQDVSRSAQTIADAQVFDHYYSRIKSTAAEGMAPGEVSSLLQQMTADQMAHRGTPLSAHLAELKNQLLEALPGKYQHGPVWDSAMAPGEGISISGVRDEYKAAKGFQRELAPFTGKDNALRAIDTLSRNGGDGAAAMARAKSDIPGFGDLIDQSQIAKAGAEFAPKMSTLPRTGLTGAAGLLLSGGTRALAAGNPLGAAAALGEVGMFGLGASPRYSAEAFHALQQSKPAFASAGRAFGRATPIVSRMLGSFDQEMGPQRGR